MKLNRKTEQELKRRATHFKRLYEAEDPKVDKLLTKGEESAKNRRKMNRGEEIAYILGGMN